MINFLAERASPPLYKRYPAIHGGEAHMIIGRNLTNANFIGVMLAALGTVSFVAGTLFFKCKGTGQSSIALNFWQSVIGAVMLTPLSLLFYPKNGVRFSIVSGLAVLYLIVVVTIAGMILWFYLIKKNGAATASIYHLINPFFGVILSYIFFKTKIMPIDCVGLVIIAGAVIPGRQAGAPRA